MILPIAISQDEIQAFCRRHHIRRLALFGSVLSPNFGGDSDIDVLVDYLADSQVTYFDMVRQEHELSSILGRRVDLRTPMELSRHFRKKVVESSLTIYEQAG